MNFILIILKTLHQISYAFIIPVFRPTKTEHQILVLHPISYLFEWLILKLNKKKITIEPTVQNFGFGSFLFWWVLFLNAIFIFLINYFHT